MYVFGMKADTVGLTEAKSPVTVKYQLVPSAELKNLPMTKILTMENRSKSEVSRPCNIGQEVMVLVYSCWSHRDTSSYEISTCYH